MPRQAQSAGTALFLSARFYLPLSGIEESLETHVHGYGVVPNQRMSGSVPPLLEHVTWMTISVGSSRRSTSTRRVTISSSAAMPFWLESTWLTLPPYRPSKKFSDCMSSSRWPAWVLSRAVTSAMRLTIEAAFWPLGRQLDLQPFVKAHPVLALDLLQLSLAEPRRVEVLRGWAISMGRYSRFSDSHCGGRRPNRPELALNGSFMRYPPGLDPRLPVVSEDFGRHRAGAVHAPSPHPR